MDEYECIYGVVDYHAITIEYETGEFARRCLDIAIILIACGLDPARCHVIVQSHVREHTELSGYSTV